MENLSPLYSNFRIVAKHDYFTLPLLNFHLFLDSLLGKYSSLCFHLHFSIMKLDSLASKNNTMHGSKSEGSHSHDILVFGLPPPSEHGELLRILYVG